MAYPIPKGHGRVVGSHVWQGGGVHAEGAHTEASCPSYRSAKFLSISVDDLVLWFYAVVVYGAALAVLGATEWQNKPVTKSLALHLQNDQAEP